MQTTVSEVPPQQPMEGFHIVQGLSSRSHLVIPGVCYLSHSGLLRLELLLHLEFIELLMAKGCELGCLLVSAASWTCFKLERTFTFPLISSIREASTWFSTCSALTLARISLRTLEMASFVAAMIGKPKELDCLGRSLWVTAG
jgi:hypothetical protein